MTKRVFFLVMGMKMYFQLMVAEKKMKHRQEKTRFSRIKGHASAASFFPYSINGIISSPLTASLFSSSMDVGDKQRRKKSAMMMLKDGVAVIRLGDNNGPSHLPPFFLY